MKGNHTLKTGGLQPQSGCFCKHDNAWRHKIYCPLYFYIANETMREMPCLSTYSPVYHQISVAENETLSFRPKGEIWGL